MENLKVLQVVKYGAVLGLGLTVAKVAKPVMAGALCGLIKKYLPDVYNQAKKEVFEKRNSKES